MNTVYGLTAIVAVCIITLAVGAFGLRLSRTTSDFYVAGRTVTPYRNASAIGGEYLSAASFLGIAGLVYSSGFDMLWFPVGYTVGEYVAGSWRPRTATYPTPQAARDEGYFTINDIPISLIDTAGLRETTDTVESIGVERSRRTMADADR